MITILGSCRQYSIKNHFQTTSVQENLTFPHYTKEIIQAIEYCKGIHGFDNSQTRYCFRTGILQKREISNQKEFQRQFENTDLFILEIASRISYEWKNLYVHHILTEEQYGFHDIPNIVQRNLTDEEIEEDLLRIQELVYPKKLLVIPHVYTRESGKRYELVKLLERLTAKYGIPFMNPSELLKGQSDIYHEETAFHYTKKGDNAIAIEYKKKIDEILKKAVVLVWKSQYKNYPRTMHECFWGIGDMLRGAIGLFKLSKKYNFRLIVDKSFHPIADFFISNPHMYSKHVKETIDDIPLIFPDVVENYIVDNLIHKNTDHICFYSNMPLSAYNGESTAELKEFIRTLLQPTDKFTEYMDAKFADLNQSPYNILHYRLGDDELVRSSTHAVNYENVYNHVLQNYKVDDILITDSKYLKDMIQGRISTIRMFDTKPCHIGHEGSYENLQDTLLEFFLLMRAHKIRSFTKYGWISGFVSAVHHVFDIPLEGHSHCHF